MNIKLRTIAFIELVIIIALVFIVIFQFNRDSSQPEEQNEFPLLSKKIQEGIMEDRSFAIVNFVPLRKNLEEYIKESDENISVYVENLRNGAFMGINERVGFQPASLSKIPLAILIMKKVEANELQLDTMLEIRETDRLDTFGTLYQTKETQLPLQVILEKMLKESDNTAMNVLLHYVSSEDIAFMQEYYGLDIRLDFPEFEQRNHSNTLSAKALSNLFLSLYFSTVLEAKSSSYLLSLMEDTTFDIQRGAQIPDEVKIVHKFGQYDQNNTLLFHDCGLMYIEESRFFYCVMSKGENMQELVSNTEIIVNRIYQYIAFAKEQNKEMKN